MARQPRRKLLLDDTAPQLSQKLCAVSYHRLAAVNRNFLPHNPPGVGSPFQGEVSPIRQDRRLLTTNWCRDTIALIA